MKCRLDDNGNLMDEKGEVVKIGDDPVLVEGALTQKQVDAKIQERLAREKQTHAALKSAAEKMPELQQQVEASAARIRELEEQAANATKIAEEQVHAQLSKAQSDAEKYRAALELERTGHIRTQVTNAILAKAGDRFINPALDVVPKLLEVHKREPVKGSDGKPLDGQSVDVFKLRFKNEKGEDVEDFLPVDKALEVMASSPDFRHYVRAQGPGGSGGGTYTATGMKRSTMTPQQKAEFVGQHGLDAFKSLPA
jgi:phage-related protein